MTVALGKFRVSYIEKIEFLKINKPRDHRKDAMSK